jgi:hypothetical protein
MKKYLVIMTLFNWKIVTHAASTDGLWTRTSTWGGTALAGLIGLSMCAFLTWMVVARWLSGGRWQAHRSNVPVPTSLLPGWGLLGWLVLTVLGFNYSSSGGFAGHTSRTEIWFGSSSSLAPFWFAIAGIVLWAVLRRLEGYPLPARGTIVSGMSA